MGLCAQLVTAIFGGPEVALFPPVVKVSVFMNFLTSTYPSVDSD